MNINNKKIDTLVIGNNIASFLTSAQILKSGHKAIYLKDKRIKANDPYFKFFGPIDLAFIRAWISDLELDSEVFEESTFFNDPFYLKFNNKQTLCAGKYPHTNLMQLGRHFPELYIEFRDYLAQEEVTAEEFNNEFLEYCRRMGETLCRYKTFHQVSAATFKTALPSYILGLYRIFKNYLKTNDELRKFLCAFRCIYTHNLETSFSDLESIYYFLLFISPRYRFQWQQSNEALANDTIDSLGGLSLEDVIEEFSFSRRRPWAVQLSSYTGVMAPRKVALFSSNLAKLNIGHNYHDLYSCVQMKYRLTDQLIAADYFIFDELSFGGEVVFVRKQITAASGEGTDAGRIANIKIYKKYDDCLKFDFCCDDLKQVLLDSGIVDSGDELIEGRVIDDICLLRNPSVMNSHENIELKFRNDKGKLELVKSVYYQGPLKKNYLAITQTLLEARDFKTFI